MKFVNISLALAILPCLVFGQFKTRQPVSGNLVQSINATNSYSSQQSWNSSNVHYQSGSAHHNATWNQVVPASVYNNEPIRTHKPAVVFVDKMTEFLNKTRSSMASGMCFKDVPTASLVHGHNVAVPRGNASDPTMSRIEVCCEGYERNPHIFRKCDPICKDDCPNGICTAPDTCVCLPGNVRDYENNCVPTCPIGCRNGNCQPDGSCVCKPGFVLDPLTKQFCKPHCSKGCNYGGECVAPETCRCAEEYELSPAGTCQPKCDSCQHGTCTAPGVCTCNQGYERKHNVCEPICSKGCNKGTCSAPETCSCKPGFSLDASGANCVPHCDKPCLNGFCDGHNVCACHHGYILDANQPNVCKAHCPNGCPNGYCSAPNFCLCKYGYVKSGVKGRQTCVPAAK